MNDLVSQKIQIIKDELKNCCTGNVPKNIAENDHAPVEPPPTINDIITIVNRMHNGTSPVHYRINIELIKYGPVELMEIIHIIISRVWSSNVIPIDWLAGNNSNTNPQNPYTQRHR